MANQAEPVAPSVAMGGAFVEDVEAQARFVAHKRYLAWRRRLLPVGKKRVLFYARPETERRGFELGVLALSLVAKKRPEVEFVLAGFKNRSVDLPFPAILPGVLALAELGALYRSCDVALVLSHTNLSLLPLEVMACGCAVVSNEGPNTEWLLTKEAVLFAKL